MLYQMDSSLCDQEHRRIALDTTRSFIVQAPAGSGKTSLLVQRYLALLDQVVDPREILAITFTRKAAAKMRQRITEKIHPIAPSSLRIQTIDSFCYQLIAQAPFTAGLGTTNPTIVQEPVAERYYLAASQALLNELTDKKFPQRQLLKNLLLYLDNDVGRFTSLCIEILKRREQWLPYIVHIKVCAKNESIALREMLEKSLKALVKEQLTRCQQIFPSELLNEAILLANFALANLSTDSHYYLMAENIKLEHKLFTDVGGSNISEAGVSIATNLLSWQQLIVFLLTTRDSEWRKKNSITKTIGFPAATGVTDKDEQMLYRQMKERIIALIEKLERIEGLKHALTEVKHLPLPLYTEEQWQVLDSLIELLPRLVAQLNLIFQTAGVVDYTAISLAAERILGSSENITDVALNLDYRIKHILVDEFQDISFAQYRLIEKLIAGWEVGDGHTLFLVGDPMQSIYRFRQAEVGLFLRAANDGIGNVKLEKLQLVTNFRSVANIVNWVNENFTKMMPPLTDVALGCTPFCKAQVGKTLAATETVEKIAEAKEKIAATADIASENSFSDHKKIYGVEVHLLTHPHATDERRSYDDNDDETQIEAQHILGIIKNIIDCDPQSSIAILVSARSHLGAIISSLKTENISYHAVDLERLNSSAVIQDLLSLTRALINLADRIAWLAILRAPWCGLSLSDLHLIANAVAVNDSDAVSESIMDANDSGNFANTILWHILSKYHDEVKDDKPSVGTLIGLSTDGRKKLARFLPIIQQTICNRGRQDLRLWIENCWRKLGGPACIEGQSQNMGQDQNANGINQLETVAKFFDLLDATSKLNGNGDTIDIDLFEKQLAKLYLSCTDTTAQLQIMTIHRAKGLEFDHVIVSGLHHQTRSDVHRLFMWLERSRLCGGSDLLLAPLKAVGVKESAVYNYLRKYEQEKDYYENGRLLYVAATRAKQSLHLVALVKTAQYPITPPPVNSLLNQLLPCIKPEWIKPVTTSKAAHQGNYHERNRSLEENMGNGENDESKKDGSNEDGKDTGDKENKAIITTHLSFNWWSSLAGLNLSSDDAAIEVVNPIVAVKLAKTHETVETLAKLGVVLHHCIRQLAQNFVVVAASDQKRAASDYCLLQEDYWCKLLVQAGLFYDIDQHLQKINMAVFNMLTDERGLWILNSNHRDAHNEYAISAVFDNVIKHFVIDRTFVDTASNVCWIVDYKTTPSLHGDRGVASEYRKQLEHYARALVLKRQEKKQERGLDQEKIMLGLYFPLYRGWYEWELIKNEC